MTEKRYFKKMWEEEYYIFDSQTISEKEFDEKVEYEDYQAFADSMMGDEVVNRLNELNDKNKFLSDFRGFITMEHQKTKEENKQLKHFIQELTTKGTGKIHLANGSIYKIDAILIDFKR